jgi:hypothetical protein
VIHRDVKPANLIIDSHGVLKILDFGVARIGDTSGAKLSAVAGTPGYMSPEQIRGEVPDHRSDQFAAGAVFYELLSYTSAFVRDEDTPASVMMRIMNAEIVPLGTLCHGLDLEVERVVHTALAREPAARFPDMGAMKAAIEKAGTRGRRSDASRAGTAAPGRVEPGPPAPGALEPTQPLSAQTPPQTRGIAGRRSSPLLLVAAAAAAALVLAVAGLAWLRTPSDSAPPDATPVAAGTRESSVAGGGAGAGTVTPAVAGRGPSTDSSAPAPLALGEVVTGRLAASREAPKYHYWLVDVPPGDYKIVVDARRTDEAESNIIANLDWYDTDGTRRGEAGNLNDIGHRTRSIFPFSAAGPQKAVLRYDNQASMSDYWLGIFRASDRVPAPFFVNPPAVTPITLGQPADEVVLDFANARSRYAYHSATLAAGDYKLTVVFRRVDGASSNVGGHVEVLGSEGEVQRGGARFNVNEIGVSGTGTGKLSLAEEALLLFKTVPAFASQRSTLTLEKWVE